VRAGCRRARGAGELGVQESSAWVQGESERRDGDGANASVRVW
jgi:hypothetical protein